MRRFRAVGPLRCQEISVLLWSWCAVSSDINWVTTLPIGPSVTNWLYSSGCINQVSYFSLMIHFSAFSASALDLRLLRSRLWTDGHLLSSSLLAVSHPQMHLMFLMLLSCEASFKFFSSIFVMYTCRELTHWWLGMSFLLVQIIVSVFGFFCKRFKLLNGERATSCIMLSSGLGLTYACRTYEEMTCYCRNRGRLADQIIQIKSLFWDIIPET